MKLYPIYSLICLCFIAFSTAGAMPSSQATAELAKKVSLVTNEQDELQADVQELVAEQTNEDVIILLEECQDAMNDAVNGLEEMDTGNNTIAAQTEVIEKIFQAAEKKASSSANPGSAKGMLELMKGMMGRKQEEEREDNQNKGSLPGDQPGQGLQGDGEVPANVPDSPPSGRRETRKLPKSSGSAGMIIPREFTRAMDAYNKASNQKSSTEQEKKED